MNSCGFLRRGASPVALKACLVGGDKSVQRGLNMARMALFFAGGVLSLGLSEELSLLYVPEFFIVDLTLRGSPETASRKV
jgi:hypothetical protein